MWSAGYAISGYGRSEDSDAAHVPLEEEEEASSWKLGHAVLVVCLI